MAYFLNNIFGAVDDMCVVALVTLAITIIFKTSFTTNFSQGVISAAGAFVVSELLLTHEWPIWLALPLAMLSSMAIAVCVDVFIFRRGRYVNALSKQIITMGLISLIVGALPLIFTSQPSYKIQSFILGDVVINFSDGTSALITKNVLLCAAITVVVISVVFVLLRFSKWGLAVRATASNEYVAGMMGINTHMVTAVSWGLAGALGALAATILASTSAIEVSGYFMTNFQVYAFLAGILGGFSTFYGPVIAGLMIPLANNLVVYGFNLMGQSDLTRWSMVVVYAIALVIIFFRPQGIFGKKIARKV